MIGASLELPGERAQGQQEIGSDDDRRFGGGGRPRPREAERQGGSDE